MMRFFKLRTRFGGLIEDAGHQVSIATVCLMLGGIAGAGVALGQTVSEPTSNTQSSTDVNTERQLIAARTDLIEYRFDNITVRGEQNAKGFAHSAKACSAPVQELNRR